MSEAPNAAEVAEQIAEEDMLADVTVTVAEDDMLFLSPTETSGAVRVKEADEILQAAGFTLGYVVLDTGTLQYKQG